MQDTDCLETLNKIEQMIRRLRPRNDVDIEQLAVDIWLELWLSNSFNPTRWLVKARVIDQVRQLNKQKEVALKALTLKEEKPLEPEADAIELVNKLMTIVTKPRYRKIVYLRFYLGLTLEDIGKSFGLSKETIRQDIRKILYSLRHKAKELKA